MRNGIATGMVLVLAIPSAVFNGFIFSTLWGWFVVPTFGLPSFGWLIGFGIMLVASHLTHQYPHDDREIEEQFAWFLASNFLAPALLLLSGWIAQMFL